MSGPIEKKDDKTGKGWQWARERLKELGKLKALEAAKPEPDANVPLAPSTLKFFGIEAPAPSGKPIPPRILDHMHRLDIIPEIPGEEMAKYLLFPLKGNPGASMTPEEYEKFMRGAGNPFVPKPTRIVFDPKTGKPVPEHLKPDAGYDKWWQDATKGDQSRRMLDKDRSLTDDDKREIAKAVEARFGEVGQNGKTIGDIVGEEVRKHLARKAEPTVQTGESRMDPEAALRIIRNYLYHMLVENSEVNMHLTMGSNLPEKWEQAGPVAALDAIPKEMLGRQVSGNETVRDLVIRVREVAISGSLRDKAKKLLE